MKTSTIVWIIVLIIVLGGGAWVWKTLDTYTPTTYVEETQNVDGTTTVNTVNTTTGTTTPGAPTFSMVEVGQHTTVTSCYTVISGKVYDLTAWVNLHPGGKQAILSLCGVDGTQRFMQKHGSAPKPNSALARYYIGNLAQ